MPPEIDHEFCIACRVCVAVCPNDVIDLVNGLAVVISPETCTDCEKCVIECPAMAISIKAEQINEERALASTSL